MVACWAVEVFNTEPEAATDVSFWKKMGSAGKMHLNLVELIRLYLGSTGSLILP
jgi:hypothetical protein